MFFKIFKWIGFALLAVLLLAGWFARTAMVGDFLYPYKLSVVEPVRFNLTPSADARDRQVQSNLHARFEEISFVALSGKTEGLDKLTNRGLMDALEACEKRVQKQEKKRAWQRAQDLSARCLAVIYAFERVWEDGGVSAKLKDLPDVSVVFAGKILETRGSVKAIAEKAVDNTDFLGDLEKHIFECSQNLSLAKEKSLEIFPKLDVASREVLTTDLEAGEKLLTFARKSLTSGDFREGWWLGSEVCGYAEALEIRMRFLEDDLVTKLLFPLEIKGFSQLR